MLCAFACAAALLGLGAVPAQAHTSVESTSPAAGSRLDAAPAAITLFFDEAVQPARDGVLVLDGDGRRVATGRPHHRGDDAATVETPLPATLPTGSYAVIWRVVSADGHPADGSFSFGVGAPAGAVPARPAPDPVVRRLHAALTASAYVGAGLLVGGGLFLLTVWPAMAHERRPRGLVRAGWSLSLGAAAALLLLQGPYDVGDGPGGVLDPGLLGQTLTTRPGILLVVRLFVLVLAAAAGPWPGDEPPAAVRRNAAVLSVLLLPTFSLAGHSGEGPLAAAAVVSDTLHLAAAAGWLGGLATLTACPDALDRVPSTLRARPTHGADVTTVADGTRSDQATVWSRWSTCAVTAVCVLAVTGAFQAWRQVPSPDALVGTSYGRLLLVKLCLVAILLALGNSARRALLRARGQGGPRSRLRRSILAELVVGLAVVAVTTLLVGLSPPR